MSRLAIVVVALFLSGCAMTDEFFVEEEIWPGPAIGECTCQGEWLGASPVPTRATRGVVPASATIPPPPLVPQTREPELLSR